LDGTGAGGNTGEFFGNIRNDMPRIIRVRVDASGDGRWDLDNIEYGVRVIVDGIPEPPTLLLAGSRTGCVGLVPPALSGKRHAGHRALTLTT
jgi:hypothetical protein